MKLVVFQIKECIGRADWSGAVAALADYYGLQLPVEYKLDVIRDPRFISEVELFYSDKIYMWSELAGLSYYNRNNPYLPGIAADIYVSAM